MYLRLFRLTNIDVGIGALINCYVIAYIFDVFLQWEIYVLLFAVVWVIYTLDRIVDTYHVQEVMLSRHYFHRKYRVSLLLIALLFTSLSVYLLFHVADELIKNGLLLSLLVLIYLLIAWKKYPIPKEILIAVLYSCGIFLAPLTVFGSLSADTIWLLIQHTMLALANLIIISSYENETDRINGQRNITHVLIKPGRVLLMMFVGHCILMAILINIYGWVIQLSFTAMWLVFALVFIKKEYFQKSDRYGIIADGAFFIPLIVLVLQ